jgi:hypothetical protein
MSLEGLFIRDKQLRNPGAMTEGYPILLPRIVIKAKDVQKQGRRTMPTLGPTKDLKGLKEPPTVRMKLGWSEMKIVQNFNLKVRERKPNPELMP